MLGWLANPIALSLPAKTIVRIVRGPARGLRWITGSGMPNFWFGTYEREKLAAFATEIRPGSIVYDIGANVGIYTLTACRRAGHVFAFEPAAMNLFYLNEHIRRNNFTNCEVIPKAVSDRDGFVQFTPSHSCLGRIATDGLLRVASISIDSFVRSGNPAPQLMKIDVEGAEYSVLVGAKETLRTVRPVLFIATHGREVHELCCELLRILGYELQFLAPDEIVARHSLTDSTSQMPLRPQGLQWLVW